MGRALWLVANLGPCFSRTTASVASWQASQTHVCFSNTSLTLADCFLFGLLETYLLKSSTFLSKAPNAVFLRPTPSHFKFSAKGARSAMLSQRGNQSKSRGRGSHNRRRRAQGGRENRSKIPSCRLRARISLSLSSENVDSMLFPRHERSRCLVHSERRMANGEGKLSLYAPSAIAQSCAVGVMRISMQSFLIHQRAPNRLCASRPRVLLPVPL